MAHKGNRRDWGAIFGIALMAVLTVIVAYLAMRYGPR